MNYGSTDPEAAAAAALPKAAQPIGSPRRAEIQDMAAGGGGFLSHGSAQLLARYRARTDSCVGQSEYSVR